MRVLNEDKTLELKEYDLEKGYLVDDEIKVPHEAVTVHHEAVAHVEEQGHYEVIREYPNGGKDVMWVVDVPYVEGCDAYDEEVSYLKNQYHRGSENLHLLRLNEYGLQLPKSYRTSSLKHQI